MVKQRKNFLPTFLLAIFFWLIWGFILFKISPESIFSLLVFFIFFFLAIFLTSALIFANSRRGLLLALLINLALFFRYYQVGNLLNLLLLLAIFVALETLFTKR